MTRKSTAARKTSYVLAAVLGMLLCRSALGAPPADAEAADVRGGTSLHGYLREARSEDYLLAQRTVHLDEARNAARAPVYALRGGEATQSASLATGSTAGVDAHAGALTPRYRPGAAAPGFSAPVDASLSVPLARADYLVGSDLQLPSDRARRTESQILLRSSDAMVRAKLRLTLGREWLFVYGDMGPADSALRWQGLVGIRLGRGANLLGGWRRMTYYFSPGRDFNALDYDGPFLAAQRSW